MDPERENYADPDLPPPVRWAAWAPALLVLGMIAGTIALFGLLALLAVLSGPRFDD